MMEAGKMYSILKAIRNQDFLDAFNRQSNHCWKVGNTPLDGFDWSEGIPQAAEFIQWYTEKIWNGGMSNAFRAVEGLQ